MNKLKSLLTISLFLILVGCNRPIASSPTPDLFATLQASTPSSFSPPAVTEAILTPAFNFSTPLNPTSVSASPQSAILFPSPADQLTGHIVFTCQLFKVQAMDQVCIMNADGSGMRRLTTEDNIRHFYPSLAPDGQSVLYSAFRAENDYEIYSLDLNDSSVDRLTNKLGVLTAPEVSPDGESILFARGNPRNGQY